MNQTQRDHAVLKVGELASRAGLTVRTLHHYDNIGLLKPSARAPSGYRLYSRADVARLYQVQALRRLGLPLAEISKLLAQPDMPFSEIVARQVDALGQQIAQATALRERLLLLQHQLGQGTEPDLADWLSTLELMTVYGKHFSPAELKSLPFSQPDEQRDGDWAGMVAQVQTLTDRGVPVTSPQAQQLAVRWMQGLERDTAANPDFAARVTAMVDLEPSERQRTGITPKLKQYVMDALAEFKLAIYAKYLDAEELRHLREHHGQRDKEWLGLIVKVYQHMASGAGPSDTAVQGLTRQWFALFRLQAGEHPAALAKIRLALDKEPSLLIGSWVNADMLDFIRRSAATLQN